MDMSSRSRRRKSLHEADIFFKREKENEQKSLTATLPSNVLSPLQASVFATNPGTSLSPSKSFLLGSSSILEPSSPRPARGSKQQNRRPRHALQGTSKIAAAISMTLWSAWSLRTYTIFIQARLDHPPPPEND